MMRKCRKATVTFARLFTFWTMLSTLSCCQLHEVMHYEGPPVSIPDEYYHHKNGHPSQVSEWWKEFGVSELNEAVAITFERNLDLKQAWSRLLQACAIARIERSAGYPQINLRTTAEHRTDDDTLLDQNLITTNRYSLAGELFWEVDLWQRIQSKYQAALWDTEATQEDFDDTALLLSGVVTELWFTIQEQRELAKLIEYQVEVNRTLLELLELRFSVGESSALDVYQQRVQLAASEAELPPVISQLETVKNQLNIVMGGPPDGLPMADTEEKLVELPPFPSVGTPMDLLIRRPDLRSAQDRVMAADYEVASAIAERFPKLTLFLTYEFSARDWNDIFERQIFSIIGDLLTPIADGGRRRFEVERRKAIVCETLYAFGQLFLNALGEVEDAIVQEREQLELIARLEKQMEWSRLNLSESKSRYMNGLTDYLNVIAAIQSTQMLERRMVTEQKNLLLIRANLYLALGGFFLSRNCDVVSETT